MPIKSVKMKISKKKVFFSHVTRITQPKNQIPRSKGVLSSSGIDGHTDRQTHTKVNTEDTLLGFHDFSYNLSSRIGPIVFQQSTHHLFLYIFSLSFQFVLAHGVLVVLSVTQSKPLRRQFPSVHGRLYRWSFRRLVRRVARRVAWRISPLQPL